MKVASFFRKWLDRVLVLNLFIVILGSLYFFISIILNIQGIQAPFIYFQKLWKPFFIPIITIMISSILISGAIAWLRPKEPDSIQDNEI